jgi:peroxiredoxin
MTQLESSYDEFTKRGAGLVVIAAQKIEGMFRGKEYIQQHDYPFPVLFDENRTVTRAYGVYHRLGVDAFNIAHPATFVVGPDGIVSWIAISPSQAERPDTEDILKAITEAI